MKDHSPPRSADMLSRWADAYARQTGQDVARVRRWISFMAFGGALEKAGFAGQGPRFSIKGGVSLELRLRGRARPTKDLDLVLHAVEGDLVEALDDLLKNGCEGFTFRRRGDVRRLGSKAVRAEVAVQYGRGIWGRIQVDLARTEGSEGMEVEMVEGMDLSFFRFDFPERVPCLSLYAQAAQKIHAVSRPSRPGRENERFKDLVDLLLIEELIQDHDALRRACEEVFATRCTHAWPPFVEAPASWAEPFRRMAVEVGLPVTDVNQAAFRIRRLLNDVEPTARLFKPIDPGRRITAANWYYALGADDTPHRVPADAAEALIRGGFRPAKLIRPEWERDTGGIVLVEVRIFLCDRKPVFVAGTSAHGLAIGLVEEGTVAEYGQPVWDHLAVELLRRTRTGEASLALLAGFLPAAELTSSKIMGRLFGVTIRGALNLNADTVNAGNWTSPVWSLADHDIVLISRQQPLSGTA